MLHGKLQSRMNRVNRFVAGCECNRTTLESIGVNGFDVRAKDTTLEKAPRFLRPAVVGRARASAGAAS